MYRICKRNVSLSYRQKIHFLLPQQVFKARDMYLHKKTFSIADPTRHFEELRRPWERGFAILMYPWNPPPIRERDGKVRLCSSIRKKSHTNSRYFKLELYYSCISPTTARLERSKSCHNCKKKINSMITHFLKI